jgi:hypothetical protein
MTQSGEVNMMTENCAHWFGGVTARTEMSRSFCQNARVEGRGCDRSATIPRREQRPMILTARFPSPELAARGRTAMNSTDRNRSNPNDPSHSETEQPESDQKPTSSPKADTTKHVCALCCKPSDETFCGACTDRIRAEATAHKRWEDKGRA